MSHPKIQNPRKANRVFLLLSFSFVLPACLSAQTCSPGTTHSVSYDTVVVSTNAAASVIFSIPKISPAKTLLAVVAQSSFTIEQGAAGSVFFVDTTASIQPAPEDGYMAESTWFNWGVGGFSNYQDIDTLFDPVTHLRLTVTGPSLAPGSFEAVPFSDPNTFTLGYDSVSTFPYLSDFVGVDTANIFYAVNTFVYPMGPDLFTANTNGVTAHISFTLYYCDPILLASDLLTFTAERGTGNTVLLNWSTADEQPDRKYEIEVSDDGIGFNGEAILAARPVLGAASYSLTYVVPSSMKGKLYFRLKEVVPSAPDKYSDIRVVGVVAGLPVFVVYPNPAADFLRLTLPVVSGWQVDIFDANGRKVQSDAFTATDALRVDFHHKMAAGAYFIRATDLEGRYSYSTTFIVSETN
jgi:hypothetical protein